MSYVLWDLAKTSNGTIYWISDEFNEQLYCMECNGMMIPVRGEIKQHHFRHTVEENCSGESAQHWSKKYKIHQISEKIGHSEMEKAVGKYIADIRFENKWAYEVVITNPPSDEKMIDLKDRLIIFDFSDENWENDIYMRLHSLEELVSQISTSIMEGNTDNHYFPVCPMCRRVKGDGSRIKSEGICFSCDFARFVKARKKHRN
jgi:hypothetical protein